MLKYAEHTLSIEHQGPEELMQQEKYASLWEGFESQFQEPFPIEVQRCGCGVASLETTLRSRGYLVDQNHTGFTSDYMTSARFTVPAAGMKLSIDGEEVVIPVSYSATKTFEEVRQDAERYLRGLGSMEEYEFVRLDTPEYNPEWVSRPAFTIEKGFDHRGIQPYFDKNQLPLRAEIINGNVESLRAMMTSMFKSDVPPTILLSVAHSKLGRRVEEGEDLQTSPHHISTHIVAVHDVVNGVDGSIHVVYTDPDNRDFEDGVRTNELEAFLSTYSGHGTIIRPAEIQE